MNTQLIQPTGNLKTVHRVEFDSSKELCQIRLPRSNTTIHGDLPKLELQFLENNFTLEVFLRRKNQSDYQLAFSEHVDTEKIIQDLIIPIEDRAKVNELIIRGQFTNLPIVVYATQAADDSSEDTDLGERLRVIESLRNNYTKLKNRLDPELSALNLSKLVFRGSGLEEIDPSLLFSDSLENVRDEENIEDIARKLEDQTNGLIVFTKNSELLKEDSNIKIYLNTLNDLQLLLRQMITTTKSSVHYPYFIVNTSQTSIVPKNVIDIGIKAIEGNIDHYNEISLGIELLKSLVDIGFNIGINELKAFDDISISIGLEKNCLELYKKLLFNGELTNVEVKDKIDIPKPLEEENVLRKRGSESRKHSRSKKSSNKDRISRERKDKKERKEKKEKKHKKERKEKKEKKERKERKHSKSPSLDKAKDKKERKDKKDKRDKKKKEKSPNKLTIDNDKHKDNHHYSKDQILATLDLKNLYHYNTKRLLYSTNVINFNICYDTQSILTLKEYINLLAEDLKTIEKTSETTSDMTGAYEDIHFHMNKVLKYLRTVTKFQLNSESDNNNIIQEIKSDIENVVQTSNSVYKTSLNDSEKYSNIISYALAKFLNECELLKILLLVLVSPNISQSYLQEEIVILILKIILFISDCVGGVSFLIKNQELFEDYILTLKTMTHVDEKPIYEENDLNEINIDSKCFYETLINLDKVENDKTIKSDNRKVVFLSQYYFYLCNLNIGMSIVNDIYKSLLVMDTPHDLMLSLIRLNRHIDNSLIAHQSFLSILKEEYIMNTFILIIKVDSIELYGKVRLEISLVCEILYKCLLADDGRLMYKYHNTLSKAIESVENHVTNYFKANPYMIYEKEYLHLEKYLHGLIALLRPIKLLSEDFQSFVHGYQEDARYTLTNINTLLSNKQHFLNVEREFPRSDKKKLLARYNDYLAFFKTEANKNNKLVPFYHNLKIINYTLGLNSSLFYEYISANIFDVLNFVTLVSELIASTNLHFSLQGRHVRKTYMENNMDIMRSHLMLLDKSVQIFIKKLDFKENKYNLDKEYENYDLFISLIELLTRLTKFNPRLFIEVCSQHIFELASTFETQYKDTKISHKKGYRNSKLRMMMFVNKSPTKHIYIDEKTTSYVNSLIVNIVRLIDKWSSYPGSYDVLLSELIFMVFNKNSDRSTIFYLIAVFLNGPKRSVNREKFRKIIHTLFFEKVRTLKKSKLVLIQKYGSLRSDSLFDIHVTRNGYGTTIEYVIESFVTIADPELFNAICCFLAAIIDWKDFQYVQQIHQFIDDILIKQLEHLNKTLEDPDECQIVLKKIAKLVNLYYFLSCTGTFKIYLIETKLQYILAKLLDTLSKPIFAHEDVREYSIILETDINKIYNIFMEENVGFPFKKVDIVQEEKYYTEILQPKDIHKLVRYYKNEFRKPNNLLERKIKNISSDFEELDQEFKLFILKLKVLKNISTNPVGKLILLYGEYMTEVLKKTNPSLKLKHMTDLFNDFISSENSDNRTILFVAKCYKLYLSIAYNLVLENEESNFVISTYRIRAFSKIFGCDIKEFTNSIPKMLDIFRLKLHNKHIIEYMSLYYVGFQRYLTTIDDKSKQIERYPELPESVEIKLRLQKFNKSYFKLEKDLLDYIRTKPFYENAFYNTVKVIKNWFLKASDYKNINKLCIKSSPQYLAKYRGKLTSSRSIK